MDSSGKRVASAAAAFALASFNAPTFAQTVQITCDVERALAGFGGPNRPNHRYEWRFIVDADAPSVTWVSRPDRMNSPTGGSWLFGRAAPAVRTSSGELTACLIDTGVCGQTISTDMYDEIVTAMKFSPDLSGVSMMMTSRFVDGVRTVQMYSGSCA